MFVFSGNNANIPTNPRKHRRLEEKPSDEGNPGDIPVDSDMNVDEDDDIFDDEDIELIEGDVTRSEVNGLISVNFSERVQKLTEKSFNQTVVQIGYTTLRNKLQELWKPMQAFKLMDIDNDYYLATFKENSDFLHVITEGPWTIFGHYLTVEPWSDDFATSQPYPAKIWSWIRLPGLPATLYKKSLITAIGECIGPVIKIDYQTESGHRGCFARMAVKVDLRKPLISKLIINGNVQIVEYESLPRSKHTAVIIEDTPEPNIHPHKNEGLANANVQNHTLGDLPDPPNGDKMQANQDTSTDKILAEDRIGDCNTRYFHRKAISRKQHNKITSLKLQNDTWCEDDSILQEEAVRYFTSIFSLDKVPGSPFSTTVSYPKLPPELMQHLDEIPSDEEIHAALRNVKLINILDDVWLPQLGPLRNHLLNTPNEYSLSDLTTVNGEWDIDKLSHTFTTEAISHIISVKCSDPTDINDKIIWRWSKRNNFEINSAYSRIALNTWEEKHPIWDQIWKFHVPQRIRLFLWLTYRERLMTNSERFRRSFGRSASCPRCSSDMESTIHALRDCKEAKETWLLLLPQSYATYFFQADIKAWLQQNLSSTMLHHTNGIPWNLLFISTLWQIWKYRNDFVFNSSLQIPPLSCTKKPHMGTIFQRMPTPYTLSTCTTHRTHRVVLSALRMDLHQC
ncbi:hypothetical protein V6N12_009358 [Hibiscus sabdariffa]|uniref:DUF4283 domain-containing protein n=1 Tax=Hibiscus sabdariffa TaxID=183260 RepID=A0ABR2E8W6_9ROSI